MKYIQNNLLVIFAYLSEAYFLTFTLKYFLVNMILHFFNPMCLKGVGGVE